MKRLLLIACIVAACSHAWGGGYDLRKFSVTGVVTTTVETAASETAVTGKPLVFSFLGGTNMTVVLRTVSGIGLSQTARTLVAATNAMSVYRVLPESDIQYLYNDKLEMAVYSAEAGETNAEALVGSGFLLIEKP
jgi:hypothetical protein